MKSRYVREQRTICTDSYMDVDLFEITERKHKSGRGKKEQPSRAVQDNLNKRRSFRHRLAVMNTNFAHSGFYLTLTYDPAHLPDSFEAAVADRVNYLRRVAAECKRRQLPAPKYMGITAGRVGGKRLHHHMCIDCGLTRDELEGIWQSRKDKLGRANCVPTQADHESLAELAGYFERDVNRAWFQSRNLAQPRTPRPADAKYKLAAYQRDCKNGDVYDREYWRKRYPDYELASEPEVRYDELNGWSVHLSLYKPFETKRRQ